MGSVFAQTKGNKRVNDSFGNWSFGAGINVVDDSGTEGNNFFNTKENWNVSNPYLVSVEYYFDNQWSIVASGSINKYVSGKNIDSTGVIVKGFAADYFAVDMATRFSFGDMFTSYNFDFSASSNDLSKLFLNSSISSIFHFLIALDKTIHTHKILKSSVFSFSKYQITVLIFELQISIDVIVLYQDIFIFVN
jgi:hypothetical protein